MSGEVVSGEATTGGARSGEDGSSFDEQFKPRGTVAVVALIAVVLVLLWLSLYLILLARGVTV